MTHPTTGGVSASFASVGDLNFAEPKALIGLLVEESLNKRLVKTT